MIVVWFSCGAASAVALQKTIERYGADHEIRAVNQPVKEEHHDNRRFLNEVGEWLGIKIELNLSRHYPSQSARDVWAKRKYMEGIKGAPCTMILKRWARQEWENEHTPDWHVLGFTYEEKDRHDRFVMGERENVLPVLIDACITKDRCFNIIQQAGIELPEVYKQGFPNANCIGCVKATSPTYWNLVREKYPDVFADRAAQADELGIKLVRLKGERIPLSDLPVSARGGDLKRMPECGLFCEEGWEE